MTRISVLSVYVPIVAVVGAIGFAFGAGREYSSFEEHKKLTMALLEDVDETKEYALSLEYRIVGLEVKLAKHESVMKIKHKLGENFF